MPHHGRRGGKYRQPPESVVINDHFPHRRSSFCPFGEAYDRSRGAYYPPSGAFGDWSKCSRSIDPQIVATRVGDPISRPDTCTGSCSIPSGNSPSLSCSQEQPLRRPFTTYRLVVATPTTEPVNPRRGRPSLAFNNSRPQLLPAIRYCSNVAAPMWGNSLGTPQVRARPTSPSALTARVLCQ